MVFVTKTGLVEMKRNSLFGKDALMLEMNFGKYNLSVVRNSFSYGSQQGKFEIFVMSAETNGGIELQVLQIKAIL